MRLTTKYEAKAAWCGFRKYMTTQLLLVFLARLALADLQVASSAERNRRDGFDLQLFARLGIASRSSSCQFLLKGAQILDS